MVLDVSNPDPCCLSYFNNCLCHFKKYLMLSENITTHVRFALKRKPYPIYAT